jgi:hypothetical protein
MPDAPFCVVRIGRNQTRKENKSLKLPDGKVEGGAFAVRHKTARTLLQFLKYKPTIININATKKPKFHLIKSTLAFAKSSFVARILD